MRFCLFYFWRKGVFNFKSEQMFRGRKRMRIKRFRFGGRSRLTLSVEGGARPRTTMSRSLISNSRTKRTITEVWSPRLNRINFILVMTSLWHGFCLIISCAGLYTRRVKQTLCYCRIITRPIFLFKKKRKKYVPACRGQITTEYQRVLINSYF